MPTQGHMTRSVTRVSRVATLAWGALAVAAIGCTTLDGPDQNAPTQQSVTGAPNAASVIALAQGLMFGTRTEMPDFIFMEGTLGREGYCLCANEPRFISELLIGPIDPGSLGADIFLGGIPTRTSARVICCWPQSRPYPVSRPRSGRPRRDSRRPSRRATSSTCSAPATPAAFRWRSTVIRRALLRRSSCCRTHSTASPSCWTMQTPSWRPAALVPIRAHDRVHRVQHTEHVCPGQPGVAGSGGGLSKRLSDRAHRIGLFISTAAPLTLGAYDVFSTNPGDALNTLYDPGATQYFAHPSFVTDAQMRADNTPDLASPRRSRSSRHTRSRA